MLNSLSTPRRGGPLRTHPANRLHLRQCRTHGLYPKQWPAHRNIPIGFRRAFRWEDSWQWRLCRNFLRCGWTPCPRRLFRCSPRNHPCHRRGFNHPLCKPHFIRTTAQVAHGNPKANRCQGGTPAKSRPENRFHSSNAITSMEAPRKSWTSIYGRYRQKTKNQK